MEYVTSELAAMFADRPSSVWLDDVIARIRREPPLDTVTREATAFDAIAAPYERSLLLFGAGWLGRFVLNGLRAAGVEPIAFIDNNPQSWGTVVDGMVVLAPADALARHGTTSCVVVTVYNGSAVTHQLGALGFPRMAHIAPLFWKYADTFIPSSYMQLPHWLLAQEAQIRAGYAVLADDASRREFCEQLLWRFSPTAGILSPASSSADLYFPDDIITPHEAEVYVDCGAFDGDSARAFVTRRNGMFGALLLLEPDAQNRTKLERWVSTLSPEGRTRVSIFPFGASDTDGEFTFQESHNVGSTLLGNGGDVSIACRTLDTLLADESPTFIKMDIEGAEPMALAGGAATLRTHRPVLAICVYHRSEHLWEIPSLIHKLQPGYRIFVRRYAEDCWELVCYAVPEERLASGALTR